MRGGYLGEVRGDQYGMVYLDSIHVGIRYRDGDDGGFITMKSTWRHK